MFYIAVNCPICSRSFVDDKEIREKAEFHVESYQRNPVFKLECSLGHKFEILLLNKHYDILFQTAINALNDGYHQQAVMSASSAMERFFEHITKEVLVNSATKMESIEDIWRPLENFSERQYGAFIFAAALVNLEGAGDVYEKKVHGKKTYKKIRNDCVHKGEIPERELALSFLHYTYSFIKNTLKYLADSSILINHLSNQNWSKYMYTKDRDGHINQNKYSFLAPTILETDRVYLKTMELLEFNQAIRSVSGYRDILVKAIRATGLEDLQ